MLLIVPGDPVPNARARRGKGGRWYTPDATREFRERVQAAWMVAGRPHLGTGPLEAWVTVVCARPPSHLLADGMPRAGAPAFPPADGDNFEKSVWDALNRLAYGDDSQIVRWSGEKRYAEPGEEPHTVVELQAV